MKSRKKINLLLVGIFILGFFVFLYPTVSDWLAAQKHVSEIALYESEINALSKEYIDAEWAKAEEYNDSLRGDPVKDPFIPGSGMALPKNYLDVLSVDGVMASIEIPVIQVKLPIYHGVSEEVLQKGVGHMEGTALPIGGKGTHALLTGHTGLPSATLFSDLSKVVLGDKFYIRLLAKELVYQVDKIDIIEPDDVSGLVAHAEEDLITLITCTPYGVNSHRLLVRGHRVYQMDKTIGLQGNITLEDRLTFVLALAAGILLLLVLAHRINKRRKTKKRPALSEPNARKTYGRR